MVGSKAKGRLHPLAAGKKRCTHVLLKNLVEYFILMFMFMHGAFLIAIGVLLLCFILFFLVLGNFFELSTLVLVLPRIGFGNPCGAIEVRSSASRLLRSKKRPKEQDQMEEEVLSLPPEERRKLVRATVRQTSEQQTGEVLKALRKFSQSWALRSPYSRSVRELATWGKDTYVNVIPRFIVLTYAPKAIIVVER